MEDYWRVFPTLRAKLFSSSLREGYSEPLVSEQTVKQMILGSEEFSVFKESCLEVFEEWKKNYILGIWICKGKEFKLLLI